MASSSIFQMLQIRWLIDPMHVEVNVSKNVIKHLYGTYDPRSIQEDAQEVGVMKSCWIKSDRTMPNAPWALPKPVLKNMNHMICNLKFPSHYGAGFQSCSTRKDHKPPIGFKSHDHHKFMHHVLLVALQCCDDAPQRRMLRLVLYNL